MTSMTNIQALIIDMDGVLWHGEQPLPGLADFFDTLRTLQLPFVLATNNASLTPGQYVHKLARMGIVVELDKILTSAMATALYLAELPEIEPASTRVFVIGEQGATQPLLDRGFILTEPYALNDNSPSTADIVVCGLDRQLTWDKLATATLHIRSGAKFIGTNADTTLPTEHGMVIGNGSILAALKAATGVTPTIIGKPEPIIYQQALSILGVAPTATVAIGDRLDTDILGAIRTGIRSIMVLTGISSKGDLQNTDYEPTWIVSDIRDITKALRR
jgi:HAD superfamily hydrolase (TIGR01457 family)